MKPDQERVRSLLTDTIALLCKNGLHFNSDLRVQGLLGVTVDGSDVFIVHIDELINAAAKLQSAECTEAVMSNSPPPAEIHESFSASSGRSEGTVDSAPGFGGQRNQRRKRKASSPLRIDTSANCLPEFNDTESESPLELSASVGTGLLESSNVDSSPSPRVKAEHAAEDTPKNADVSGASVKIEEPEDNDDVLFVEAKDGVLSRLQNQQGMLEMKGDRPEAGEHHLRGMSSIYPSYRHKPMGRYDRSGSLSTESVQAAIYQSHIVAQQFLATGIRTDMSSSSSDVDQSMQATSSYKRPSYAGECSSAIVPRSHFGTHHESANFTHRSPPADLCTERAVHRLLAWSRGRGHMSQSPARRKRYECTLNDCGRQYLNTFDLYRHQRQKHMMPADFYQQGKKQTFGIREVIDPS